MENGQLITCEPCELIEVYHDDSHTSWSHPDHKARECTFDEWLRKWHTHVATLCESSTYLDTHAYTCDTCLCMCI